MTLHDGRAVLTTNQENVCYSPTESWNRHHSDPRHTETAKMIEEYDAQLSMANVRTYMYVNAERCTYLISFMPYFDQHLVGSVSRHERRENVLNNDIAAALVSINA